MSQYTSFFIRSRSGEYMPIGTFSRNSRIAHFVNSFAPYEAISPVTSSNLKFFIEECEETISKYQKEITILKDSKASIPTYNNSVDEKLEAMNCISEDIDSLKEEISDVSFAKDYFISLGFICEEAESSKYYDDESKRIDKDNYLFVGIEIENPTDADARYFK